MIVSVFLTMREEDLGREARVRGYEGSVHIHSRKHKHRSHEFCLVATLAEKWEEDKKYEIQ